MRPLVPAFVVLAFAAFACSGGEEANRDGESIVEAGTIEVFDTRVGDCLDLDISLAAASEVTELAAIPCEQAHRHEVFHLAEIDGFEVYPGPSDLASAADGLCLGAFEDYVGTPYLDSPLQFTYLFPSLNSWQELEDRTVVCILVSTQPTSRTMRNATAGTTSEDALGLLQALHR